jgi:molybdate transport system substrate-binding protein
MQSEFEKQSGHRVTFTFAHVSVIQKRLAAGEQADVVLLPASLMANVEKTIGLRPEGTTVFARIGIGVLAREGQTGFDIATPDGVRKMLLAVRTIAVPLPAGLTGSHLMQMMTKLGIEDAVRAKLRHKPAVDGAGHLVATGEADVGLYLVSEIQNIKGTTILGMLPAELQNYVTYSVAMPVYNKAPEPGASFIKFMTDPARQKYWKAIGFELVEAGK